jgi:hypothetical protein
MSYEGVCLIARVMLIADMSYARVGRVMYITVDSISGSERIRWTNLDDGANLHGVETSGASHTQDIEECLLGKVHATYFFHLTFRFLLVF